MALARKEAFLLIFLFVGTFAFEDNNVLLYRLEATEKLVTSLSERVNLLEAREIVHITRISNLESRDKEKQKTIEELRHQLKQKQHDSVKTTFNDPQRQQHLHDSMETTENGPQQHHTNISRVPSQVDTLETKQQNVRSVPRIRQAAEQAPIAFFASRTSIVAHAGRGQVLIFNNVQTNVGNAYNKHMGMFTAPVDGIYVFSTTMVAEGRVDAHVSFFKNSNMMNSMYVSVEAAYDTTSSTIALSLIKGDIITVRNVANDVSYAGNNHCSVTGFLLYGLSTTSAVVG